MFLNVLACSQNMVTPQMSGTLQTLGVNKGQFFPCSLHKSPGVYSKVRYLVGGGGVSNVSRLAEDFPGFSTESLASQEPTQTIMICPGLFQLFKMESPMSWKPLFSEGKLGSLLPYQTGHVTAALPKWDEWRVYSRKLWWEDKMSMSLGDVDCPCCGVHPTQSGYMQEIPLLEKNTQTLLNNSEVSATLVFSLPEYHPSLTRTH